APHPALAARPPPRAPPPADWLASGPYERHPALPGPPAYPVPGQPPYPVPGQPPYPARTAPFWRQGWADYDPYASYPIWPGHPGYATRNAGLRRLSKLTWRAAEVSAVIAVGFAALFARTAQSAPSHAGASPATVQVWAVPHAGHTLGLATAPRAWDTHVISFLNAALHPGTTTAAATAANSP